MDRPLTNSDNDRDEHRRRIKKPIRSRAESAIRQMRKRLNMLRDYQADTLSHRAGDVELAVETVIFEQLVRQSKTSRHESTSSSDSMLHSVLENVQGAISQLAEYRECDRQEHQRLMEQHAKLVNLTQSIAETKTQPPAANATSVAPGVPLAEHELIVSQLQSLTVEHKHSLAALATIQREQSASVEEISRLKSQHDELISSIHSNQTERTLAAERLAKVTLSHEELSASANAKQLELARVTTELQELKLLYKTLLSSSDGSQSEHKLLAAQLSQLQTEHSSLLAAVQVKDQERESALTQLGELEVQHNKLLALYDTHQAEQKQLVEQIEALKEERDQLLHSGKQQQEQLERLALQVNDLTLKHERLVNSTNAESSKSADSALQIETAQATCRTLEQQLAQRTSELVETQLLLDDYKSKSETASTDSGKSHELLTNLRDQLTKERQSVVELRMQVDDLKATVAETSNVTPGAPQQLTWDQQKALLLKKLEGESQLGNIDLQKSLDIKDVIERANQEVGKRDCEIMELKRLLAEQSTASQSIAIGAAAVAEMLDHDDFIREERDNLRVLQEQLQAKLREAEVEISLERAKLARQRSEMEDRADSERALTQAEDAKNTSIGSRWRSRLGLGEQEKL